MPFLSDDYQIAPPPPPLQDNSATPLDTPDEILAKEEAKRRMTQDPLKRIPYPGASPFPPGSAQQKLQDWSTQGPPPPPKPKLWQKLAAGVLAGGAGYLNANAGRPGGLARPVDVEPGVAGVLGIPQYNRAVQNWSMQGQTLDKAAQQERYEQDRQERAREADMRDKEAAARIAHDQAESEWLDEQRRETAEQRKQRAAQFKTENLQRYKFYDPNTEIAPVPLQASAPAPARVMGPPPAPSATDLPLAPPRAASLNIPTPPPPGYFAADAPEGAPPGMKAALPTPEEQDRIKKGVRPVPPELHDYLPFSEAPDTDIRAAIQKKADDQRAAVNAQAAADRQAREDAARDNRQENSLAHADDRAANMEALRTKLQQDMLNAQDGRQAKAIYSNAVNAAQKQAEIELAKVDQEFGNYAHKNDTHLFGLIGTPKDQLSPEQQKQRDSRVAEINQRKADAIQAAEEAFRPYKNGQPAPAPAAAPVAAPARTGAPRQLTPQKAAEYLQKAGGDKDKARALAKADNYTF